MGKQIVTTFNGGFESLFQEIKKERPDLSNNSEIAKESVRKFWEDLKSQQEPSIDKRV